MYNKYMAPAERDLDVGIVLSYGAFAGLDSQARAK